MGNGASAKHASPFQLDSKEDHMDSVNCIWANDEGTIVATGGDDCTVRVWATSTQGLALMAELCSHTRYVTSVLIVGNDIYSASADYTIKRWNLSTSALVHTYEGHRGMVNRVICTGDLLVSSSYDCTARAWLLHADNTMQADDACVRVFRGHNKGVYPMVFIPAEDEDSLPIGEEVEVTEDLLVTGSSDGTARSWSMESAQELQSFRGHVGPVQALAASNDCRSLFTGGLDGYIRQWSVAHGELLRVMRRHSDGIVTLIMTVKFMYSASADRTARSWLTEFGENARTFKGHRQSLTCITIHDGVLYTGCGDGVVRAFEAKTGILLRRFKGHYYTVNAVKVAGSVLYSTSFDGTVRAWSIEDIKDSDDADKFPRRTILNKQAEEERERAAAAGVADNGDDMYEHPDEQIERLRKNTADKPPTAQPVEEDA